MKRNPYSIVILILLFVPLFSYGCTLRLCAAPEYVVTRTDDIAGGLCTAGNCTLRQAVFASNVCGGEQVIRIPEGTYTLTLTGRDENSNATGDLDIIDRVRIIGNGMPVIDGNASDRVFDIQAAAIVEMTGLVIQNGYGGEGIGSIDGGGISNAGELTATGVLIRNNVGRPLGTYTAGGLTNTGSASISHSAILSNTAGEGAGGVANYGDMTLDNVTISGNDAYGIFFSGRSLEISYSTITDNVAYQIQGSNPSVPVVIRNSIVGGYPEAGSCRGTFRSEGFNLEFPAEDVHPLDNCNFTQSSDLANVNPMLLPLSAYDGTTPPFHPLDPASPAIDSADPANCSGTDQRGVARPQGSACDRGAYESEDTGLTSIPTLPPLATEPPIAPPGSAPFILIVQVPANCRQGPGVVYPVVNSALPGEQVQVIGKSADGTWWYSQLKNDKCFISNIAGTPQGDLTLLSIIPAPPTPAPTEKPAEEKPEPTDEVIADPDNDGDGYPFSKDCNDKNPKINPGAVETPDDKIDSNCNGDDDK